MTISEILGGMERHTGQFPFEAMRAAVSQREAVTPELLRALQAVAEDAPKYAAEEGYMLHLHALYLLAQFKEKRAFPMVIKLISWPGTTSDDLLGETICEGLACILASVFDGDLEPMMRLALDEQTNEYARGSAIDALGTLYAENLISREQLISLFGRLYQGLKEDDEWFVWCNLVGRTADLGLVELLPQARQAFTEHGVKVYMLRENMEATISKPGEKLLEKFRECNHLVEDAIAEMSWWAAFDEVDDPIAAESETEDDLEEFDPKVGQASRLPKPAISHGLSEDTSAPGLPAMVPATGPEPYQYTPPVPYHAPPKIGRNDPCPCGSGKKYKKCCLGAGAH
jgi:uncharacterized protein YecA (UPF0149 family)